MIRIEGDRAPGTRTMRRHLFRVFKIESALRTGFVPFNFLVALVSFAFQAATKSWTLVSHVWLNFRLKYERFPLMLHPAPPDKDFFSLVCAYGHVSSSKSEHVFVRRTCAGAVVPVTVLRYRKV